MSDLELAALAIPARNALLDDWAAEDALAASELAAEGAWLRAAEQGHYAGSEEEALDRFLDSLVGR